MDSGFCGLLKMFGWTACFYQLLMQIKMQINGLAPLFRESVLALCDVTESTDDTDKSVAT